jgi:hypothetical protein
MQYLTYFQTFLGLVFILVQVIGLVAAFTKSQKDDQYLADSQLYQIARSVYAFVKKEDLLGRIVGDDRIVKALEMLSNDYLVQTGQRLTEELKDKAKIQFKGWHAEDKVADLANAVAVEAAPGKKSEG